MRVREATPDALAPSSFESLLALDQAALDLIPVALFLTDRDGALVRWNAGAAELWGGTPALGVYTSDGQRMLPCQTPMAQAVRTGAAASAEMVIEAASGVRTRVQVSVQPARDAAGRMLGAINCLQTLTDTSEAVRESEERFRVLADGAPALIWVNDLEGCAFVNRNYLEFLGVGAADVEGTGWMRFVHPEDLDRYIGDYEEALRTRGPFDALFRFKRFDDAYRWMRSVGQPRIDKKGELLGYSGITLDITGTRAMEEARQQLIAIIESSEDAIISKDLNGVITSWNTGAERLFGYTPEEVIGKPVTILIPEDHLNEEPFIIERVRRGERVEAYDTVRRRKDGSLVDISLAISPVKDVNGNVVGASKIARDITARKRSEEQRTLLINELNHRVKNTLATVQSLSMQTLRSTERSEDARERFEARLAALSRAHDVLTAQNWQSARLRQVVDRALKPFLAERFAIKGSPVRLSPKQTLALSMALHELATNAAKYGALANETGHVEIDWRVEASKGGPRLVLTWTEVGGPPVSPPMRAGFGSRLIERSLSHDLGARAEIEYRPEGIIAIMRTPIESVGGPMCELSEHGKTS